MSSLRARLVVGGALITIVAVGSAAVAVGTTDHLLSIAAADRALEADLRGARFRAVGRLVYGWGERRRTDGRERDDQDEAEPRGRDRPMVVAWSLTDPDAHLHSGALDPATAATIRTAAASDGTHGLDLDDGRRLRLLRDSVVEIPRPPRRRGDMDEFRTLLPIAVVVVHDVSDLHRDLLQRRTLLAATVAAAGLLAGLGAWLFAGGLLRPLGRLGREIAATRAAATSEAIRVPGAPRELVPVIDHLNGLLERVAEAVRRERRVNADIAHELRTPLSGMRSQLEFALADEARDEDLREAAASALAIAVQMQDLVENLLTMARLDAGQVETAREAVAPADIVAEAWRPLAARARERDIQLDAQVPPDATVETDPTRLRLVVTNLLANAVAHAPAGSRVEVSWDGTALAVANPAPDLAADDLEHMHEPFWRGDRARSDTGLHCGLGLAIAHRLCRILGGRLELSADSGRFTARVAFDGGDRPAT